MTCLQAAHSVHQCVYRCAMHWRRITAKRLRQRGGRPKLRPVVEAKPDWPVISLPGASRSVPLVQPLPVVDLHRCVSGTVNNYSLFLRPHFQTRLQI